MRMKSCVTLGLGLAALAGCMAFPQMYLHDYEGDVAANPILAVEDGRRFAFAQLTVTKNDPSQWRTGHTTVLLDRDATPTTQPGPPVSANKRQLSDQSFLRQCYDGNTPWRNPIAVRNLLQADHPLISWDVGYVVSTRPFAVAYAADAEAFEIARYTLARRARTTQPATTLPVLRGTVRRPTVSPEQQNNFVLAWVEPIALAERVDTLQVLVDAETLRVVHLDAPMTIDALLDLLASPGGIEPDVADELRQSRPMGDLERAIRERDAAAIPRL